MQLCHQEKLRHGSATFKTYKRPTTPTWSAVQDIHIIMTLRWNEMNCSELRFFQPWISCWGARRLKFVVSDQSCNYLFEIPLESNPYVPYIPWHFFAFFTLWGLHEQMLSRTARSWCALWHSHATWSDILNSDRSDMLKNGFIEMIGPTLDPPWTQWV